MTVAVLSFLSTSTVGSAAAMAATTKVLLKSGDAASDGVKLSLFGSPIAARATKVAFFGTTSALMTKSGATYTLTAKTGDALPAPLSGTFNAFFDPAINNAGRIVFRATLNSTSAESGLFFYDGSFAPIVLLGGTMGGPISVTMPPEINSNADPSVVYLDRTRAIYRWRQSTGVSTLLVSTGDAAPGGGTFSRFGNRPVINDSGVVAFEGEVSGGAEGIFTVSAPASVTPVAQEGGTSPIAGGTYKPFSPSQAVSINSSGEVAFTANINQSPSPDTSGVFLYHPVGPATTVVAQQGDLVGSSALTGFDGEYVGVDSSADVAFEGRFTGSTRKLVLRSGGTLTALTGNIGSSPTDFAPRLTDAGRIIWRRGRAINRFDGAETTVVAPTDVTPIGLNVAPREPSINNSDVATFRATHDALYILDRGTAQLVVTPGATSPGTGTFSGLGVHSFRGTVLAFTAADGGGRIIVFKRGARALAKAVAQGDATPLGGTFDVSDDRIAVSGQNVLFESTVTGGSAPSGIFAKKLIGTGTVTTIVKEGDPAPGGANFQSFTSLVAADVSGKRAAFTAGLDSGSSGVFLAGFGAPRKVAVESDPAPGTGGGTFASSGFDTIAAAGRKVLFAADVNGGTTTSGLFLWNNGVLTNIMVSGGPAPVTGGGTFGDITPLAAIDLRGASAGFVAPIEGSLTVFDGLFLRRGNGVISPLALAGDATPIGPISSVNLGESISVASSMTAVYEAAMSAASGVSFALLSTRP